MIIKLPFTNDEDQTFTIQLSAQAPLFSGNYKFRIIWNYRIGVWCMDMYDANSGAVVFIGVPLVLGCDLLEPLGYNIGRMIVFDETGTHTEADFESMGDSVNVYWISPDEDLVSDKAGT